MLYQWTAIDWFISRTPAWRPEYLDQYVPSDVMERRINLAWSKRTRPFLISSWWRRIMTDDCIDEGNL